MRFIQFKMFAVDDVFTEEDFYLCKMFGDDCRFVEVSKRWRNKKLFLKLFVVSFTIKLAEW